jgi:ferredoxin-NADP reductase
MYAVLDHIEAHGGDIVSFWFRPERPIRFNAGQYIELYLPHEAVDSRGTRRWFTISSSPNEQLISLTTGFPKKPSSYKQTLRALRVGSEVVLSEPLGDFVLPKDRTVPLVFVAAGTGCTPYASMTKWLIKQHEERDIQLLYAASSPDAFLFTDLWSSYRPLRLTRMVSHASSAWHEHIGSLDSVIILQAIQDAADSMLYLAGPQSLIEPLYDELLKDVPRQQVLLDYFPGY